MTSCAREPQPEPIRRRRKRAVGALDLAALGHEIRSPLATLPLLADLIADADTPEARQQFAAMVRLAAAQAMAVADDFIADGALASGRLVLNPTTFDPAAVARDIASLYEPALAAEGRRIAVIVDEKTPRQATTDLTRLRQVLINLVTNAIRARGDGDIILRVGRGERRGHIAFTVEDDGPGLPADFAIAPFHKGEASPGTGLGLAISARLVTALGGTLTFAARPPRGTSARFSIRRLLATARRAARSVGQTGDDDPDLTEPARALVVDDNEVARQLIDAILTSFDIEVITAADGEAAADELAALPFDIVVLDWSLRCETGADVLDRLEASGRPLPPVIVVSASARTPEDGRIAAFLRKPFSPRDLYQTIVGLLEGETRNAEG